MSLIGRVYSDSDVEEVKDNQLVIGERSQSPLAGAIGERAHLPRMKGQMRR